MPARCSTHFSGSRSTCRALRFRAILRQMQFFFPCLASYHLVTQGASGVSEAYRQWQTPLAGPPHAGCRHRPHGDTRTTLLSDSYLADYAAIRWARIFPPQMGGNPTGRLTVGRRHALSLCDRAGGTRPPRLRTLHPNRSPSYSIKYVQRSACGITACGRRKRTSIGSGALSSSMASGTPWRWARRRFRTSCQCWPSKGASVPRRRTRRSVLSSFCTVTSSTSRWAGLMRWSVHDGRNVCPLC